MAWEVQPVAVSPMEFSHSNITTPLTGARPPTGVLPPAPVPKERDPALPALEVRSPPLLRDGNDEPNPSGGAPDDPNPRGAGG